MFVCMYMTLTSILESDLHWVLVTVTAYILQNKYICIVFSLLFHRKYFNHY